MPTEAEPKPHCRFDSNGHPSKLVCESALHTGDYYVRSEVGRVSARLPIRTRSELNCAEGWQVRRRRQKIQQMAVVAAIRPHRQYITLPATITFTRIAPRSLDEDNHLSAWKHIRDSIADILIPGLRPGRADGDKRLTFRYAQAKGKVKEHAVEILITSNDLPLLQV